jgi:type IV pilus modification protein PilV
MLKINRQITPKNFAGFGVLEVLISSLVIAIALLGLIRLQTTSIHTMQNAYYNSLAANIAQEFIARLQANPLITSNGYQAGVTNNYLQLFVNDPIDLTYAGNVANWYNFWFNAQTDPCYAGSNFCSPYDLALTDKADMAIYAWNQLPGGRITVCFDSSNPNSFVCDNNVAAAEGIPATVGVSVFTVKVQWNNLPGTTTQCLQTKFTHSCTNPAGC